MSRSLSDNLIAHVQLDVTSLTTCITVVRTKFQPSIGSISNSTAGVVACNEPHEFATGDNVRIANLSDANWLSAEGDYTVTSLSATHFRINLDTTAFPVFSGTGDALQLHALTPHDEDIPVGNIVYKSIDAATPTGVNNTVSMAAETIDIDASNFGFSREDYYLGMLDAAILEVFKINYESPTDGIIKMLKGVMGEPEIEDHKVKIEMRGLKDIFRIPIGDLYSQTCRADFGDKFEANKCKLDRNDFRRELDVGAVINRRQFQEAQALLGFKEFRVLFDSVQDKFGNTGKIRVYSLSFKDKSGNILTVRGAGVPIQDPASTPNGAGDSDGWNVFDDDLYVSGSIEFVEDSFIGFKFDTAQIIGAWFIRIEAAVADVSPPRIMRLQAKNPSGEWLDMDVRDEEDLFHNRTFDEATFASEFDDKYNYSFDSLNKRSIGSSESDNFFTEGTLQWTSGRNQSSVDWAIRSYLDGTFTFVEQMPNPIAAGDNFIAFGGCTKSFSFCIFRENAVNFRGEPHIPGPDTLKKTGRIK